MAHALLLTYITPLCNVPCSAVLPRVKGRAADVKPHTKAAPLEAITADDVHYLRFYMGPNDKVVVEDVQNNTANILGSGQEVGNVIIYGVDKVLLSGKKVVAAGGRARVPMRACACTCASKVLPAEGEQHHKQQPASRLLSKAPNAWLCSRRHCGRRSDCFVYSVLRRPCPQPTKRWRVAYAL